ncbi:hypothetical protein [Isoptericola croceus]|uniref:hypothetical protein n=1 Tax=Isoptericola croceus TaxID=3031406 RepID=UPI0023F9524E|nr:hypothetical protein [Isoptericola croceus]
MTIAADSGNFRASTRQVNAWFIGILCFMLLPAAFVPGLPIVGPIVALLTPVRRSGWRMGVLCAVAALFVLHLVAALVAVYGYWPQWLMLDDEDPSLVG